MPLLSSYLQYIPGLRLLTGSIVVQHHWHRTAAQLDRNSGLMLSKPSLCRPSLPTNDYMGAVDIADQLRSYLNADSHSQRRGPARALTWTFLLAVALANSFLLQRLGQPLWPRYKDQSRFLEALVDEIFKEYRQTGATRQRYRAGDTSTPLSQHNHVNRHKQGYCLACQGTQIGPRSQSMQKSRNRRALGQLDENALNRQPRPRKRGTHTQWGYDVCNVAICKKPECWYFYHRQNN